MPSGTAWDDALRAARDAGVNLEPLSGLEGVLEAAAVITAVWGEEVAAVHYLRAMEHAGSVFYGARSEGPLVGFVLGFLGTADGPHLHSHMLAVLPGLRARGVGGALKLAQRAACLDAGVREARWTFDPMVAANGRFNLARLGAVATRWLPNFYGEMPDEINRGERSDRFEARWRLDGDRAERAIRGDLEAPSIGPPVLGTTGGGGPVETGRSPEPGCTAAVPPDHVSLRRADPASAAAWRETSGRVFEACFGAGLVASWMTPDRRYVFTEPVR